MKVKLIDHMGTDLSVVNAARVSFDKVSEWELDYDNPKEDEHGHYIEQVLSEKDTKLIQYLARHNHWTPFGHTAVTLHIKAPIFVARQLGKHQVGLVWNEVSRRYVDSDPEFFRPEGWRKKPEGSIKQGSGDETINRIKFVGVVETWEEETDNFYECSIDESIRLYRSMINSGICPEQARMVLPQSMYTEWYWTGSMMAFARVCKLRLDPHSQKETQEVAKQINDIIEPLFPVSWKALSKDWI